MATIKVQSCIGSNVDSHYFRLTLPTGEREVVRALFWSRNCAGYAKDLISRLYPTIKRKNIRFHHIN